MFHRSIRYKHIQIYFLVYYNILRTLEHLKDEDIYEKDKYDSPQHFILF